MFGAMMDGIKEESVGYLFNLEVQVEQQVEEVPVGEEGTEALGGGEAAAAEAGAGAGAPSLVKQEARPEIRAKGLEAPRRADRLHFSAPSVDGEGGVVEGDFAASPGAGAGASESDGLTRAERRKAAKGGGGRRRKK
jgi:preprotein translocase subunit SecA